MKTHQYIHKWTSDNTTATFAFTSDGKNMSQEIIEASGDVKTALIQLADVRLVYRTLLKGRPVNWLEPNDMNKQSIITTVKFAIHCNYPHMEELLAGMYAKYNSSVEDQIACAMHAREYNPGLLPKLAKHLKPTYTGTYESAGCTLTVTLGAQSDLKITGRDAAGLLKCTEIAQLVLGIVNGKYTLYRSGGILQSVVDWCNACKRLDALVQVPVQMPVQVPVHASVHPKTAESDYVKAASPKMYPEEITKLVCREWGAMSDAEKQSYNASADTVPTESTFVLTYSDIKHTLLFRGGVLVSVDGPYGASVHDLVLRMRINDQCMEANILAEIKQDMRTWFDIACYLGLDIKTKMLWRTFDYTINDVVYKVQFSRATELLGTKCRNHKAWECPEIPFAHDHLFNDLNSGKWKPTCNCCTTAGNISGTRVFTWLHGRVPEWGSKMISEAEARELIADHARW